MARNWIGRTILAFGVELLLSAQAAADSAARSVVEKAGISGGVACVVGGGAGLALELAREGNFLVLSVDPDPRNVARIKEQAAEAGVLGRRVYVAQGTTRQIPFADNYVDLLILQAVPWKDLDEDAQREIFRVLAPGRGRAIIGDRLLRKPPLPDADDWTHRLHGSDNNSVSADTAFRTPAMLQYLAMPMQTSFQGTMLVAGNWRIELSDWVTKKPDRNFVAGKLTARSLYNGQILWQRNLPEGIEPDMPICVLDAERIYLAADDSCRVLVIDVESGEDLPPVVLGEQSLRVKWLGMENGRLYALLGPPLPVRAPRSFMLAGLNRDIRMKQAAAGKTLVACDLATRRLLWRHEEPATIDYRTVAVHNGQTYFYSELTRLACLGPDGKLLWENRDAGWLAGLKRPNRIYNINYESTPTLIVGPAGQLRLSLPGLEYGHIFNTNDGRLLWRDTVRGPKCFFLGNRYFSSQAIREAASGTLISPAHTLGGGCGIVTWVPGLEAGLSHAAFGVKSPCGVGAFAAGGMLVFSPSQCDCWPHLRGAAAFAAAGELFRQARENPSHPLLLFGSQAQATALSSARQAEGASRELVKDLDWAQYRGGIRRTGNSQLAAGKAARVRWVAKLPHPLDVPDGHDLHRFQWLDRPTPPVTCDRLAVYAASDGSVRAVRIDNGQPAWTFWTGGPILTTPAIAYGRVYAGSGDGWVCCLELRSGKLLWKWRAGPLDRRVIMYGKLMSLWPVAAVMVTGDRVFGVAGFAMQNGSLTFAIDATTGKPLWTTWTEPAYESRTTSEREDFGFSPAGQLALLGKHLVVGTYLGTPAVFDAESGKRVPPSPAYRELWANAWPMGFRTATAGQDLIVLDDHTILQGGYPLLGNPDMRHDKSAAKFVAWRIERNGQIPAAPLPWWALPHSQIAPALDDSQIAIVGGVGRSGHSEHSTIGLSLWSLDTWREELQLPPEVTSEDTSAQDAGNTPLVARSGRQTALQARLRRLKTSLDMTRADWRIDDVDVSAVVLCPDAVVAATGQWKHGARPRYGEHPGFERWRLVAFDRATGSERWTIELPGEPVFNGLAPAADGSWLLTLRDGSALCVAKSSRSVQAPAFDPLAIGTGELVQVQRRSMDRSPK